MWGKDKKEGRLIRDPWVMQDFLEGLTKAGTADKGRTPLPSSAVWGGGNGGGGWLAIANYKNLDEGFSENWKRERFDV